VFLALICCKWLILFSQRLTRILYFWLTSLICFAIQASKLWSIEIYFFSCSYFQLFAYYYSYSLLPTQGWNTRSQRQHQMRRWQAMVCIAVTYKWFKYSTSLLSLNNGDYSGDVVTNLQAYSFFFKVVTQNKTTTSCHQIHI
jgi:ABC-type anion transport system duplicated permease subunit